MWQQVGRVSGQVSTVLWERPTVVQDARNVSWRSLLPLGETASGRPGKPRLCFAQTRWAMATRERWLWSRDLWEQSGNEMKAEKQTWGKPAKQYGEIWMKTVIKVYCVWLWHRQTDRETEKRDDDDDDMFSWWGGTAIGPWMPSLPYNCSRLRVTIQERLPRHSEEGLGKGQECTGKENFLSFLLGSEDFPESLFFTPSILCSCIRDWSEKKVHRVLDFNWFKTCVQSLAAVLWEATRQQQLWN